MALDAPPSHDLLALFELTEHESAQGLDAYLARTLEMCAEWFSASGATLFLRHGHNPDYELAAAAGKDSRVPLGATIRQGQGIAGTAIAKGEPLLLRDPFEHVLLEGKLLRTRPGIGSSLVVPLRTRHLGALGVLCLSRSKGEPEFSRHDLKIARTLGGQIALAVANARLFAQATEAAETRRMAEIGQMTASIAHEIRNPLTGIRGAAQMMRAHEGEAAEFAEIIVDETDKLDRLCNEFLDFARPMELRKEPAKLGEVVAGAIEIFRSEFAHAEVDLILEVEPNEATISLDPMRIEQVCRNLVRNALQACRQGGRVEVRVGDGILEVLDDGRGMSFDERERLFAPFFTTKAQGSGLGMSVVKKIVEAHGGRIEVDSVPGTGTVVRVGLEPGK